MSPNAFVVSIIVWQALRLCVCLGGKPHWMQVSDACIVYIALSCFQQALILCVCFKGLLQKFHSVQVCVGFGSAVSAADHGTCVPAGQGCHRGRGRSAILWRPAGHSGCCGGGCEQMHPPRHAAS